LKTITTTITAQTSKAEKEVRRLKLQLKVQRHQ
jgi:hypothetical protein